MEARAIPFDAAQVEPLDLAAAPGIDEVGEAVAVDGVFVYLPSARRSSILVVDPRERTCFTFGDLTPDGWTSAVAVGGLVYALPLQAASILVVDVRARTARTFALHADALGFFPAWPPHQLAIAKADYPGWNGAVEFGGHLYCTPYSAPYVLDVDLALETTSGFGALPTFPAGPPTWPPVANAGVVEKYAGAAVLGGRIYCAGCGAGTPLAIDPTARTAATLELDVAVPSLEGLVAKDGKLYGITPCFGEFYAVELDPATGAVRELGHEVDHAGCHYWCGLHAVDGCPFLFALPRWTEAGPHHAPWPPPTRHGVLLLDPTAAPAGSCRILELPFPEGSQAIKMQEFFGAGMVLGDTLYGAPVTLVEPERVLQRWGAPPLCCGGHVLVCDLRPLVPWTPAQHTHFPPADKSRVLAALLALRGRVPLLCQRRVLDFLMEPAKLTWSALRAPRAAEDPEPGEPEDPEPGEPEDPEAPRLGAEGAAPESLVPGEPEDWSDAASAAGAALPLPTADYEAALRVVQQDERDERWADEVAQQIHDDLAHGAARPAPATLEKLYLLPIMGAAGGGRFSKRADALAALDAHPQLAACRLDLGDLVCARAEQRCLRLYVPPELAAAALAALDASAVKPHHVVVTHAYKTSVKEALKPLKPRLGVYVQERKVSVLGHATASEVVVRQKAGPWEARNARPLDLTVSTSAARGHRNPRAL